MDLDDPEDRRRAVALFRHGVIAELDVGALPRGERSERIALLGARTFTTPDGDQRGFSVRTLWAWWGAYQRDGLAGLMPIVRSDRGVPRVVAPAILEAAIAHRRDIPSRSTATLIDILEKQQVVAPGELKRSTLDRHLERAGASRRRLRTLGDKRFIRLLFERPNQLWVGDYHEAPILLDARTGRFRTVHVCAFIDHYSKLVPHAQWYPNERIATLEDTLKKSLLKRGVPDGVYVDNGSVYRSRDFAFAVDHFGARLRHSKAYASEGRGVIERWNRTLVEQFEPEVRALRVDDLGRLNALFEGWLEGRYHLTPHGTTGEPPADRFARADFTPRYPDPVDVQDTFRVRCRRKVHPKTSTIEVEAVAFVVETFLRSRWVTVLFDPHRLDDVLVLLDGKSVQRAFPQRPNEHPLPRPERPTASPPAFDYLSALRAEYDRRVVSEAKRLSFSEWTPKDDFTLPAFLALCAKLLGKDFSPYERDEFVRSFQTVGPFSEPTCRLALEHALKLRGRGLHVTVYSHYLRTFHIEAIRALKEPR